jgi:predicted Zn-dependent peptidase
VEKALLQAFADLPVNENRVQPVCQVRANAAEGEPRIVEESLDVTQGKLAMGFRTGGICVQDEEFPALMMMNAVFGGTSMSKLFMNVRERLSLCYFASSALERIKGLLMVSSGIEFEKYRQARDEILAQLEACRRGEITSDELEGARRIIVTALRTTLDSQNRMADYWLGQAVAGLEESPEELAARVERVSVDQLVKVAGKLELDTIYFLKGKEGV